ncbi:unnamed protein product [Paramecium pentaurelia]|uniref:Myb-like domain-containing protein n=1 Tax=Paramecium pentaurelia TaxID=43138 RepID=A0A8S1SW71_9CILI|nr:unnamed protein product [Paramecium pentaurelia]
MSLNSYEQQLDLDDSCESPFSQSPKSKRIKKFELISPKKNVGHWTKEEHEKYLYFLEEHSDIKKNNKIFKSMSEVIGTRSPSQCRSHHQKFNPLSPLVQRKTQKVQKQTMSTLQDDLNLQIEEESLNRNMVKLMIFDEDDQVCQLPQFNLDDFF